ncbi:hypothetical protein GGR54DRAFT_640784 [Hypoxylon sp. NC1633]|nr:hypothetical protein GGR54DRAFT_640784 [Hypoxylon sp. NC1633]
MADGKPTLHHLDNSQSQLILWLLEEMGIEYNLVLHKRIQNRSPPALKAVHPLGKSPTLVTPSGRIITERSAIALWLTDTYDEGAPFRLPSGHESDDAVREEQLISLGGATLSPLLMLKLIFSQLVRRAPLLVRPLVAAVRYALDRAYLDAELALVMGYLEEQLAVPAWEKESTGAGSAGTGREWFLGTPGPTRADFAMMWYIDWAVQCRWVDFAGYPCLRDFHDRCVARPAWKRALEKGQGYDLNFW